jgi:hypothetical protein
MQAHGRIGARVGDPSGARVVRFHIGDELYRECGRIDTDALAIVGRLAAEYGLVPVAHDDCITTYAQCRYVRPDNLSCPKPAAASGPVASNSVDGRNFAIDTVDVTFSMHADLEAGGRFCADARAHPGGVQPAAGTAAGQEVGLSAALDEPPRGPADRDHVVGSPRGTQPVRDPTIIWATLATASPAPTPDTTTPLAPPPPPTSKPTSPLTPATLTGEPHTHARTGPPALGVRAPLLESACGVLCPQVANGAGQARDPGELAVDGHQVRAEGLRQRDVGSVVGPHVVPQLPDTR